MKLLFTLAIILVSFGLNANPKVLNVQDFGAVGDGIQINTKAIQKAVDKCALNGGEVFIPSGKFVTGTIYLKSNVRLHISENAVLLGSTNIEDYPHNMPDYRFYGDTWVRQSLFYAENQHNITITGRGTIDGQGGSFQVNTRKKPDRYRNRPYILWFVNCSNLRVETIKLTNSAMWMQHYLACNKVWIDGIRVFNHCNYNNDMIDIDGCKDVFITNCIGDSDDDALTIKSTSGRMSENVVVTNCIFSSHCNAIKFGTESSGGFKNISISNCVVRPSEKRTKIYGLPDGISGITLGMVDGGTLEGVHINNIRIDGPRVPLYMRLGNRARPYFENQGEIPVGTFKDVQLSNISATGVDTIACSFTGIPGYEIENVSLSNIRIHFNGGKKEVVDALTVSEMENHYPESTKFGALPASAFYVRHARNFTLDNIQLHYNSAEVRPAIICDDVKDARLSRITINGTTSADYLIGLTGVENMRIEDTQAKQSVKALVHLFGKESSAVYLNGNLGDFSSEVSFENKDLEKGMLK